MLSILGWEIAQEELRDMTNSSVPNSLVDCIFVFRVSLSVTKQGGYLSVVSLARHTALETLAKKATSPRSRKNQEEQQGLGT